MKKPLFYVLSSLLPLAALAACAMDNGYIVSGEISLSNALLDPLPVEITIEPSSKESSSPPEELPSEPSPQPGPDYDESELYDVYLQDKLISLDDGRGTYYTISEKKMLDFDSNGILDLYFKLDHNVYEAYWSGFCTVIDGEVAELFYYRNQVGYGTIIRAAYSEELSEHVILIWEHGGAGSPSNKLYYSIRDGVPSLLDEFMEEWSWNESTEEYYDAYYLNGDETDYKTYNNVAIQYTDPINNYYILR
ncbi:MAG: hypothetical protein LBI19_01075 [Oscillospiraceae bacterium]|jgi:uncharacterized protein YbaR (Trm112 family)|nr:hypothetical protein [Oscillospiraceae bacterium]